MPLDLRPKPVGLAARKAALESANALATVNKPKPVITNHDPNLATDRIGIVFDDSYSIQCELKNIHAGVEEFLRSCKPNTTAVSVYPMNGHKYQLTTDIPALAMLIANIDVAGCTPLCRTTIQVLNTNITRAIIFSDGSPDEDDRGFYFELVKTAKEKHIPCDTVFVGAAYDTSASEFMKKLAEETGGIFLHFDPSKSNFRTAFKYLSPGFRAMLADKSFVDKLEGK